MLTLTAAGGGTQHVIDAVLSFPRIGRRWLGNWHPVGLQDPKTAGMLRSVDEERVGDCADRRNRWSRWRRNDSHIAPQLHAPGLLRGRSRI